MKKFNKFAMLCSAMALLSLTACEASVIDDTDGTTETDTTTGSDSATGGDTSTGSDVATGPKYTWVAIDGEPTTEDVDCGKTTSPGPDIDAVLVYRAGKLIGAGKPGTAQLFSAAQKACPDNEGRGTVADVAGPVNGMVYKVEKDTGYFSLRKDRVYVQIGECTQSSPDPKQCDGNGPVIELQAGDEIDVYEVDTTYLAGKGTAASGNAYEGCTCTPETYWVGVAIDQDTEPVELGTFKGSKSAIPVSFSK